MTHPHIVRYHTAWVETEVATPEHGRQTDVIDAKAALDSLASSSEPTSSATDEEPEDGDEDSANDADLESVDEADLGLDDLDFDDMDFLASSRSASYPLVRFVNDGDPSNAPTPADSSGSVSPVRLLRPGTESPAPAPPRRTLYIQMEYVPGGPTGATLREVRRSRLVMRCRSVTRCTGDRCGLAGGRSVRRSLLILYR
jgi:translation initiation factor 2-alpha kinase 4